MMQQQAATISVRASSRLEHAADIRLDMLRIEAAEGVETDLAKYARTVAQPSIQDDAGGVVEGRPIPFCANAGRPYASEPLKPDDHRLMFLSHVASFFVPPALVSRAR